MLDTIEKIENMISRLEYSVKTLRDERDRAASDVTRLKKELDDSETEVVRLDDELKAERERFSREKESFEKERAESKERLATLRERVSELMPLIEGSPAEDDDSPGICELTNTSYSDEADG